MSAERNLQSRNGTIVDSNSDVPRVSASGPRGVEGDFVVDVDNLDVFLRRRGRGGAAAVSWDGDAGGAVGADVADFGSDGGAEVGCAVCVDGGAGGGEGEAGVELAAWWGDEERGRGVRGGDVEGIFATGGERNEKGSLGRADTVGDWS